MARLREHFWSILGRAHGRPRYKISFFEENVSEEVYDDLFAGIESEEAGKARFAKQPDSCEPVCVRKGVVLLSTLAVSSLASLHICDHMPKVS